MKLEHSLTPYTKINFKWLKNLNVRPNTVKFLQVNISGTLLNINHSNTFCPCLRVNGNKCKNKQMGPNQLTSFCTAKEIINKMKRQPMDREKIFAMINLVEGLTSKICKFYSSISLLKKQHNKKLAEDLNGRYFSKEDI